MPDRPLIAFASAAANLIAYLNDVAWLPSPCPLDESLGAVTTSCAFYLLLLLSICGCEVRELISLRRLSSSTKHNTLWKKENEVRIIKLVTKI